MRAKEYAGRYKNNPTDDELGKIVIEFMHEIKLLADSRHSHAEPVIKSIVYEQDKKWRAFAREVGNDHIKPTGFMDLLKHKFPEIAAAILED